MAKRRQVETKLEQGYLSILKYNGITGKNVLVVGVDAFGGWFEIDGLDYILKLTDVKSDLNKNQLKVKYIIYYQDVVTDERTELARGSKTLKDFF